MNDIPQLTDNRAVERLRKLAEAVCMYVTCPEPGVVHIFIDCDGLRDDEGGTPQFVVRVDDQRRMAWVEAQLQAELQWLLEANMRHEMKSATIH